MKIRIHGYEGRSRSEGAPFFIGIDNGVSGTVGVVNFNGEALLFIPMPIHKELNYTKTKGWINRIAFRELVKLLTPFSKGRGRVYLERPMVNPQRWKASVSALRAMEATLLACESLNLPVQYVDSKEWQKFMLPSGLKKEALKSASRSIGQRIFPILKDKFKHDADSILMAEWARRTDRKV